MPEPKQQRGRPHDARAAQAAILDAAEAVFAEHGFAGGRMDAIAAAAGYNKSLIYHYFDDKLGLYTAVLQRAEAQGRDLQDRVFGSPASAAAVTTDAGAFRAFVEEMARAAFDYFAAHPRLLRIIAWEEAEGWTTLSKILSRLDVSDVERFTAIFERAQRAGLLRPEISPPLVIFLAENICRTSITSLPLVQMVGLTGPGADLATADGLARAREQVVALIANGIVASPR